MPDITMCQDRECPRARRCRRSELVTKALPRQSWFMESPREAEECVHFWEADESARVTPTAYG